MKFSLKGSKLKEEKIIIPGSKSESNRLLILKSLYKNLSLENLSNSDDTNHLFEAIQDKNKIIKIGHAGTAMRFLTSLLALETKKAIELRGSERMHDRPIKILVDSLKKIGANIDYLDKYGFPPLLIKTSILTGRKLSVESSVSSQYISSLLLIAPKIKGGLEIELLGKETSLPYINMTIRLLKEIGVCVNFNNNIIKVKELQKIKPVKILIESDWSSASYYYSVVAMADIGYTLALMSYKNNSIQGDSEISEIFKLFGVQTIFKDDQIILKKVKKNINTISLNLSSNPDIAQTICVTCLALKIKCNLSGLHTLKIKETDRLVALKNEISKFNLIVNITNESISFHNESDLESGIEIETYDDHRMAMSFACLAVKTNIIICNPAVVTKSYRSFWEDFAKIGIVSQ
tara:strand:+ start:884 stop:2098 length:1215 start_codon:yes stop_codon:yes gene_type:complete